MHKHSSHPEIVKRLKRAHGHLAKVIEMIEAEKSCVEVAQQLHAVSRAIENAKGFYIRDHIENCFEGVAGSEAKMVNKLIEELKAISKFL